MILGDQSLRTGDTDATHMDGSVMFDRTNVVIAVDGRCYTRRA